ncbi:hypothetical protein F8B43_1947 [Methylorubrum populi]|uniref:Uncharacterized protein n=1 Tax=Methylorubrum populi TaxID=223967 RepID=A0A833J8U7_9HYPH|nr:hypothetical protein F8B43_1947 [Methylorubrum populi]
MRKETGRPGTSLRLGFAEDRPQIARSSLRSAPPRSSAPLGGDAGDDATAPLGAIFEEFRR